MSDVQDGRWLDVPTHLQVKPHESFAQGVITRRDPKDTASGPRTLRLAVPPSWATGADLPCHGLVDVFFSRAVTTAKRLCESCPVAAECLSFALEHEGTVEPAHRYGVFGGKTPTERWRIATTLDMRTTVDEGGETA